MGNRNISFLEFAMHTGELENLIPEHHLFNNSELRALAMSRYMSSEEWKNKVRDAYASKDPHRIAMLGAELTSGIDEVYKKLLAEVDPTRKALATLKKSLSDDAEIRLNVCFGGSAGKGQRFMLLLARAINAKVSANDGLIAGTGTGKWKITDKLGTSISDDCRSGSVPLIGKALSGISDVLTFIWDLPKMLK